MRTFTDKDRQGLARALQTFMSHANGQQVNVNRHLTQAETALAEGLTVDELLNAGNYARAAELDGKPSVEEYVKILTRNAVAVVPLRDEPGWDNPAAFTAIAEAFHDFYMEICPKGGTWSTQQAKANLQKAIEANSLQGIMSSVLIGKVMDTSGRGRELTCFQYIEELIKNPEQYAIDNSMSEEQDRRQQEMAASLESGPADERPAEEKSIELDTEGSPVDDDTSIYNTMQEDAMQDFPTDTFVSAPSPKEYKRTYLAEALKGLQISEFTALSGLFPKEMTVDEMITALSEGKIDKSKESIDARNAHQLLNGMLYTHFLNCARWQGMEISEESASKMDLVCESWDFRDSRTRKLQKIKELIYGNAVDSEDLDLLSVIEDLENLYGKEEE